MSPASDLAVLRAFLAEFDPYLKSPVVFWPLSGRLAGGGEPPALTLGGLQLVRRRLAARQSQLAPADLTAYAQLDSQAETWLNRWPANIANKASREISSRLNVWASALDEASESPSAFAENYKSTVSNRAYLALLTPLAGDTPDAAPALAKLSALDGRLRRLIIPGDFVWEADLAPAFDRDEFWFLYGKPQLKK